MFSVNNFYDYFSSYYAWPKTNIINWRFHPHGSKNLLDLHPNFSPSEFYSQESFWYLQNAIIMHDQEPCSMSYMLDTYKNTVFQEKKDQMWQQMSYKELMLSRPLSCSWPIFCHSESNSKDIDHIKEIGLIDCHYFWHGLISRDWFRHWRHHVDLTGSKQFDKKFLLYARDHTGTRTYRKSMISKLQPMADQIQYTWDNQSVVDSSWSAKIITKDAVKTAIHIVAETVFDQNKIHLTEKIFKPMVMRQPFIVFAGPGSLNYLRRYGFLTFDSVWDESYDLEHNNEIRFEKIINLISNLYCKSDLEFKKIIDQCNDIVNHNREHFFSNQFENIMLNELHNNMTNSIDLQNEKNKQDPGGSVYHFLNSMHTQNIKLASWYAEKEKQITLSLKHHYSERYQDVCNQYQWVKEIV